LLKRSGKVSLLRSTTGTMFLDASDYEKTIATLKEREKEMKCLYKVQEIIHDDLPVDEFLMEIVKHIWGGWQYPVITRVKIFYEDKVFREPGWEETEWIQSADIVIDEQVSGRIEVCYTQPRQLIGSSPFLPEEQKLLNTIAANIGSYIFNKKLQETLKALEQEKLPETEKEENMFDLLPSRADVHWLWRREMVNRIAAKIDLEQLGLEAMYLIGSTKSGACGPASDIDIMVHFTGDQQQECMLKAWFTGWSQCLSEINYVKTGYRTDGLIDLHIITDDDIRKQTSFACMIRAVTNGATLIKKRPDG